MRHCFSLTLALALAALSLAGCGHETTSKSTEKVSGPGGTTTVTKETTVHQSGQNPPPANP